MLTIKEQATNATQDPTKEYADTLWRNNPQLSPNNWRILNGRTVGKIAGRIASPFVEAQTPHILPALNNGINLWFISITDFHAQKALVEALNQSSFPREAFTIIYEFPIEHADKLAQELDLLPPPDGITFMHQDDVSKQQLISAFTAAEEMIKQGRMSFYGLMHAGLITPKDFSFHINLWDVMDASQIAAQTVYGRRKRPYLRTLNAPLNILELAALRLENHTAEELGGTQKQTSLLELAARGHLSFNAERPLTVNTKGGGLWLTDDKQTAHLRQEILSRLSTSLHAKWQNAPLENLCLNIILSLPGVTSAVVMPGVDYGQKDILNMLTPLLEEADFADIAPIIGTHA